MPNVVIIEDDARIRRQIEQFLTELNDGNIAVRSFSNHAEFEKVYFNKAFKNRNSPAQFTHPQLEDFDPSQMNWLVDKNFSTNSPFPGHKIQIHLSLAKNKLEQILPEQDPQHTIFNIKIDDLKNRDKLFVTTVAEPMEKSWEAFVQQAVQEGRQQKLFVFDGKEKGLWIIKCTAKYENGSTLIIDLEDQTGKLRTIFEKEKLRRESLAAEIQTLQLFKEIHLIISKCSLPAPKLIDWIKKTKQTCREFNYWPNESSTRFILTKYEDDSFNKTSLLDKDVDDLIFMPMDRLIFLQKVDIVLNMPKKISPTHLFTQDVDINIEISKLTKLESLSDVGLAIRNPVQLMPGLMAHFYFQLPGEKDSLDIYAKVLRSKTHPEIENVQIVYFSFFGIDRQQVMAIRRFLSKNKSYSHLIKDDRSQFEFNPDDIFISDRDRKIKNIAIIDMDENFSKGTADTLKRELSQVHCITENSYSLFLKKYLQGGTNDSSPTAEASTAEDFIINPLSFSIDPDSNNLDKTHFEFDDAQLFFGYSFESLFRQPQGWLRFFENEESQTLLLESLQVAIESGVANRIINIKSVENKFKTIRLDIQKQADKKLKLTLTPADVPTTEKSSKGAEKISSLEVIAIDHSLVPKENVTAWIEGLQSLVQSKSLIDSGRKVKFIITAESHVKIDKQMYAHPDILGLIFKPIDTRAFIFLISEATQNRYTLLHFENIGWLTVNSQVHIAKEAKLVQISEFGGVIKHPRPITPGTFLYLRGSIFDSAPEKNLCARFYHCEKDPESDQYLCSLLYFGIADTFLKFARSWFRESYAVSKQQAGGGA